MKIVQLEHENMIEFILVILLRQSGRRGEILKRGKGPKPILDLIDFNNLILI